MAAAAMCTLHALHAHCIDAAHALHTPCMCMHVHVHVHVQCMHVHVACTAQAQQRELQAASDQAARLEAQQAEAGPSSGEPSAATDRNRYDGALTELRNLEAEVASARAEVYDARAEAAAAREVAAAQAEKGQAQVAAAHAEKMEARVEQHSAKARVIALEAELEKLREQTATETQGFGNFAAPEAVGVLDEGGTGTASGAATAGRSLAEERAVLAAAQQAVRAQADELAKRGDELSRREVEVCTAEAVAREVAAAAEARREEESARCAIAAATEVAEEVQAAAAEREEARRLHDEVQARSGELAVIAARLAKKEEVVAVAQAKAAELTRRLARADSRLAAHAVAHPAEHAAGLARPADAALEAVLLQALAWETTLSLEVLQLETEAGELATVRARGGEDSQGGGGGGGGGRDGGAERELLLVKQRCRALLLTRDGELRRAHEQLHGLQQQLHGLEQQQLSRSSSSSSLTTATTAAAAAAAAAPAAAASGAGASEGDAAQAVVMEARQQAQLSAEVERLRQRAASLEARLKGAADARRAWQLREAEMLERIDEQGRLLATQGGAHNVEFLRTTLLKYLERGPESFPEFFPLFAAFLDFSEEEQLRLRQAHQRNSAGFLDGYFGSGASMIEEHHATAPAAAPAAAAAGAVQPDPLAVFGHVERPAASIAVALGDGDERPADDTAAEESASAEDGVEAAERAEVNECRQDDEKQKREEKAKTQRLKKLLGAADKRLQQAESDLDVRDAEIAALKYRLSLNS